MDRRVKWTTDILQELVDLVKSGLPRRDIARRYGISQGRISQLLKQAGYPIRERKAKLEVVA